MGNLCNKLFVWYSQVNKSIKCGSWVPECRKKNIFKNAYGIVFCASMYVCSFLLASFIVMELALEYKAPLYAFKLRCIMRLKSLELWTLYGLCEAYAFHSLFWWQISAFRYECDRATGGTRKRRPQHVC